MQTSTQLIGITPIPPSSNIKRDIEWYDEKTGFKQVYHDNIYAVLKRDDLCIHLQWHADTVDDPLLGGSVIRIFVNNIRPMFEGFVQRGTLDKKKLVTNTPWGTNEFGFFDLNKHAIFIVEDIP